MRSILTGLFLCLCGIFGLAGEWVPSGPEGGRASALVFHPQNPDILYAAGSNGVFKSLDGGRTWAGKSQGLTDCRLTDLELHPQRPQVLLAGSQEAGVFRSLDGGESWATSSQGLFEPRINDLEFNPSDPDVLYAATRNGVFKSVDGGVTWADRSVGFLFDFFIESVAVAPSEESTVYAVTRFNGIHQSLDGAESWQRMPGQDSLDFTGALAVHPQNPVHLFAGSRNGINITPDGQSWENVCILISAVTGGCVTRTSLDLVFEDDQGQSLLIGTGNGPRRLTLATREFELLSLPLVVDSTPIVQTVAASPGVIAAAVSEGVAFSENRGQDWRIESAGLRLSPANHLMADPLNPMRAYVSTEAGPRRTLDGGDSWTPIRRAGRRELNLRLTAAYTSPADLGLTNGITHGGSLVASLDEGATWRRRSLSGPGGTLRLLMPDYPGGRIFALTPFGVSRTLGEGWTFMNDGLGSGFLAEVNARGLGLDRTDDRLWLAVEGGLFTRLLAGDSEWQPHASPPPVADLWSVAVGPGGQLVLAGSQSGLYVSRDGGASWSLTDGLSATRVTSIYMPEEAQDRILAATWGHGVWQSSDNALTFQACGEGLESGFVSGLAAVPGRLLAATQGGVYILDEAPEVPSGPRLEVLVGGSGQENRISQVDLMLSLPEGAPVLDHEGFEMALSLDGRFQIVEMQSPDGKLTLGPSPATVLWDGRLEPGQQLQMRLSVKVPSGDILERADPITGRDPFSVQSRAVFLIDGDGDGKIEQAVPSQPFSLSFARNDSLRHHTLAVPASSTALADGFVGVALTNPTVFSAVPRFNELAGDGSQLRPTRVGDALGPRAQRARSVEEFAQGDLDALAVDLTFLKGFFLLGDDASRRLDGVGASLIDSELSFIAEAAVGAGVETRLFFFNPDTQDSAQLSLDFMDSSGQVIAQGSFELEPSASRMEKLRDLFAGLPQQAEGYLRLHSSGPFRAFALRDQNGSFSTLAAVPASGRRAVYMPHFVVDPSLGATTVVKVLNAAGLPAQAQFRIFCDDDPSNPLDLSMEVPARGLLSMNLAEGLPQDGLARQGSIELVLRGGQVEGFPLLLPFLAVATIDGGLLGTRSSLPFSAGHEGNVVIQQLAHSPSAGIFQGLAIAASANSGSGFITLYDAQGNLLARAFLSVSPGQRLIGLMNELNWFSILPELVEDFDIVGGWIEVSASNAVVVSLFGGEHFLSAVEPEPAP